MINEGISNLYRLLEDGNEIDGAVKPKPGNAYADENDWVKNVIFGEPCVIVQPDYSNVRSVKFRMWMKSGKAQIRRFIKMDDDTGEPITEKLFLEIEEWHVTVPIDVGRSKRCPSLAVQSLIIRVRGVGQNDTSRQGSS